MNAVYEFTRSFGEYLSNNNDNNNNSNPCLGYTTTRLVHWFMCHLSDNSSLDSKSPTNTMTKYNWQILTNNTKILSYINIKNVTTNTWSI